MPTTGQHIIGNEYDVTGTVKVSDPEAVHDCVVSTLRSVYPDVNFGYLKTAYRDFTRMFQGDLPEYEGCDTLYHDMQHTLDMSLAMARLMAGYEKSVGPGERLGNRRATVGMITALFHDSGYIRHKNDEHEHGAEYTQTHVSRSAQFVHDYLIKTGLGSEAKEAHGVVHFTGYEKTPAQITLDDPKYRIVGELLGTADLMAQMADRCYLEKCRDRLFPEFVLGGLAVNEQDGRQNVLFRSGEDLLRNTPKFFANIFETRLDGDFRGAYRYLEGLFDGHNPYLAGIEKNLVFLQQVLDSGDWELLRRKPPVFVSNDADVADTHRLAVRRLRELLASEQ